MFLAKIPEKIADTYFKNKLEIKVI